MNNIVEPEKYRKLSVASLVTGILAISLAGLYSFLWMPIANFLQNSIVMSTIPYVIISFISIVLGLSIAAVVCGSIDLKRIRAGLYSKKGKGFDIAGIVLGGVFILFALYFALGEILVPH
jgi:hypothetical protein